jgi:hypothetical protein
VANFTDSVALYLSYKDYNVCPIIYKYENTRFTGYWADYNFQNMRGSKELLPGFKVRDTLYIDFKQGIYRIEYNFTMRPNVNSKARYSNIFIVE